MSTQATIERRIRKTWRDIGHPIIADDFAEWATVQLSVLLAATEGTSWTIDLRTDLQAYFAAAPRG